MPRTLVTTQTFRPPNLLINGAMDFWQRGTTGVWSGTGSAYRAMDRWFVRPGGGTSGFTVVRDTVVPSEDFRYSAKITESGDAVLNSFNMLQRIESDHLISLIGKTVTASFWAKTNNFVDVTGGFKIQAYVPLSPVSKDDWSGNADPFLHTNIAVSPDFAVTDNNWHRYQFSFVIPSSAASGLQILFSANSINNATFLHMTGLMLTEGPSAPANFYRAGNSIAQELMLCQRYYEKSYSIDVAVATATTGGIIDVSFGQNQPAGVSLAGPVRFKVEKRIAPTIAFYTRAGGSGIQRYSNSSSLQDTVAGTANGVGTSGFIANSGATVGTTTGYIDFHYTADAEL